MGSTATPTPPGAPSAPGLLPVPTRRAPRQSSTWQTSSATTQPRFSLTSALLLGAAATPTYAAPFAQPHAPPPTASFPGADWRFFSPPPPNPPPAPPPARPVPNATNETAGPAPMSGAQRGKRGKERTYTLTQLQTALYALVAQVARGQNPKWAAAARAGGIKGCTATVRRYGLRLLRVGAEDPSHHALEQRRVAIGALELPKKGNPLLRGRRLSTRRSRRRWAWRLGRGVPGAASGPAACCASTSTRSL